MILVQTKATNSSLAKAKRPKVEQISAIRRSYIFRRGLRNQATKSYDFYFFFVSDCVRRQSGRRRLYCAYGHAANRRQ